MHYMQEVQNANNVNITATYVERIAFIFDQVPLCVSSRKDKSRKEIPVPPVTSST